MIKDNLCDPDLVAPLFVMIFLFILSLFVSFIPGIVFGTIGILFSIGFMVFE